MKAEREHRVPLSPAAVDLLRGQGPGKPGDLVFPGARRGQPLSDMSLTAVLRRMSVDVTAHGFRSSFRDWAGERTSFAREIAEKALAHLVGDESERSYARGDLFDKRRALMVAWADFIATPPATGATVTSIGARRA
jgi:integrase